MTREPATGETPEETARREFLKQVGKATVTAPAVALLLAASSKPAAAQPVYAGGDAGPDQPSDAD